MIKKKNILLHPIVLSIFLSTVGSAQIMDSAWPKWGYDLQNTGQSPYSSTSTGGLKWSFNFGAGTYSAPSVDSDGIIYFTSFNNNLYAVYPNGTEKWHVTVGAENYVYSSPAIGNDGIIYVGTDDDISYKYLYAIYPNGTVKWTFTADNYVNSGPTIDSGGIIYITTYSGSLYAVNPNGTQKWQFTDDYGDTSYSSPAIDTNGVIYYGALDGKLYAVNPNGTQKWKFTAGNSIETSPAIAPDGTIYFGADDFKLYAVNPNGTQKWTYTAGAVISGSPAIATDGTIYFGVTETALQGNHNFVALYPNGTQKWIFTMSKVYGTPIIDASGVVYIGESPSPYKFYAIYPNGTEKWHYTTTAGVESPASIGSDGVVYIASDDGHLYAFNSSSSPCTELSGYGPSTIVSDFTGVSRTFNTTWSVASDVTWYMDGNVVKTETGVTESSYTNSTAGSGTYNITVVGITSSNPACADISHTWTWTVVSLQASSYSPSLSIYDHVGDVNRPFSVTWNREANSTWYIDGEEVQANESALGANYTFIDNIGAGTYNITVVGHNESQNETASVSWTWKVLPFLKFETFEENNLDNWYTDGDPNWSISSYQPWGGSLDAQSNNQGLYSTGDMIAYINYSEDEPAAMKNNLTFYWKIHSTWEPPYGSTLYFYIDDVLQDSISDNVGWTRKVVTITSGIHTIKFRFKRFADSGTDNGYIDNINVPEVASTCICNLNPYWQPTYTVFGFDRMQNRSFFIEFSQKVNVTWYINGQQVFSETDVFYSNYTNTTAGEGDWNVTAVGTNSYGESSYNTWDWVVYPFITAGFDYTAQLDNWYQQGNMIGAAQPMYWVTSNVSMIDTLTGHGGNFYETDEYPYSPAVYINGSLQDPSNYTVVSNPGIWFTIPPPINSTIEIHYTGLAANANFANGFDVYDVDMTAFVNLSTNSTISFKWMEVCRAVFPGDDCAGTGGGYQMALKIDGNMIVSADQPANDAMDLGCQTYTEIDYETCNFAWKKENFTLNAGLHTITFAKFEDFRKGYVADLDFTPFAGAANITTSPTFDNCYGPAITLYIPPIPTPVRGTPVPCDCGNDNLIWNLIFITLLIFGIIGAFVYFEK